MSTTTRQFRLGLRNEDVHENRFACTTMIPVEGALPITRPHATYDVFQHAVTGQFFAQIQGKRMSAYYLAFEIF